MHFPSGWRADSNGKAWKYWMLSTPYWRSLAEYENPSVFVSHDGITWAPPAGPTNPIDSWPGGTAYNSDPDQVFYNDTLYAFYRQYDTVPHVEKIMLRTSANGITWSAEQAVIDNTASNSTSHSTSSRRESSTTARSS